MKKLLIGSLIFLMIVFASLVFAGTDTENADDVFKLYETINYAKPCFQNGTYCSAVTKCNYTIYYPDKIVMVNNQQATNRGSDHNISISTDKTGLHEVSMICCNAIAISL